MQKYSDALFVHCCAHRLSLVLSQAICNSKEFKIFKILNDFSAFFKISKEISCIGQRSENKAAKSCAYKMEFHISNCSGSS
jgi:hypothetical protein